MEYLSLCMYVCIIELSEWVKVSEIINELPENTDPRRVVWVGLGSGNIAPNSVTN